MIGSVAAMWRYPVKSMGGEAVEHGVWTERGLLGDRAFALRERATGHIASAKHPRKWGLLLRCRAAYATEPQTDTPLPPIRITLPDGRVLWSDQPNIDAELSRLLDRDVTLVREAPAGATREANRAPFDDRPLIRAEALALAAPAGSVFDYAPVHLLASDTLAHLSRLYPAGRFDPRRFRPNLLVDTRGAAGFVENAWIEQTLRLGAEVALRVIDPTPRCVVTTLPQAELPHDPDILRTVARHNTAPSATLAPGVPMPAVVGVYATVISGGTVVADAAVTLDRA